MPFKKVGRNSYRSPSGRKFTAAQVRLYCATDGFRKTVSTQPIRKKKKKGTR
jgi:hypothetical protein